MSLQSLKTRDLTWQDNTLNIEVLLAPTRSVLLWNKHQSLSSHCSKDKKIFARQFENEVKKFNSEKVLIDRRRADLYTKRTLSFLEKLTPELRYELLSRKSTSTSLNKIANEYYEIHSKNLAEEDGTSATSFDKKNNKQERETASATSEESAWRRPSLYALPLLQRRKSSSFGMLKDGENENASQRKKSSSFGMPKDVDDNENSSFRLSSLKPDTPRQKQSSPHSRNPTPAQNEHFPAISSNRGFHSNKKTPRPGFVVMESQESLAEEKSENITPIKYVRFKDDNLNDESPRVSLKEKIKGFLTDQMMFNLNTPVSGRSDLAKKAAGGELEQKADLVSEFEKFCQSKNKNKFHSLIRLASKVKIATRTPSANIPKVEVMPASVFSGSRQSISAA